MWGQCDLPPMVRLNWSIPLMNPVDPKPMQASPLCTRTGQELPAHHWCHQGLLGLCVGVVVALGVVQNAANAMCEALPAGVL